MAAVGPAGTLFSALLLATLFALNRDIEHGPEPAIAADFEARPRPEPFFPLGVFEDANHFTGRTDDFRGMLNDLASRGFDSILFTNNLVDRDIPLLEATDRLGFNVIFAPVDLVPTWWRSPEEATPQRAREVAQDVVERLHRYPSLRGYSLFDEPTLDLRERLALLTEAFRQLDPSRPATPVLVGLDRIGPLFKAAQPSVMLIDVYPIGYENSVGDLRMTGFGYPSIDFVDYIRAATAEKPPHVPLWVILQTHSFQRTLREPRPAELRLQHWLAIGEGATGIFWFIYVSQQGWRGLMDNPELFRETTILAQRVAPLRPLLLDLTRIADRFSIAGGATPYVSTFVSSDGQGLYVVAVNRDALRSQELSIISPGLQGGLRPLTVSERANQIYPLGARIPFAPGDGEIFEFIAEANDQAEVEGAGTAPAAGHRRQAPMDCRS